MLPKITSKISYRNDLESTTLRGFTGGLNVIDDDMNLSYKYATKLNNCFADSDGSIRVRYGTRQFSLLGPGGMSPTGVVNMEYYNTVIIGVTTDGKIWKTDGSGAGTTVIFSGWGPTTFASFAQFNGMLIIANGSDKPLIVNQAYVCDYLQDLGTATNINTPVCKYVIACGRYLVMAGDPLEPNRVHISAKDTSGTWFGDPPPNDAIHVDVGSLLSKGIVIRGLLQFRGKLLVLYAEGMIINTLGVYDAAGNHTPTLGDDIIEQYGCVSHRTAIARGDDGLMLDSEGVPSISRTALSSQFKPERASAFVDPDITALAKSLSFLSLDEHTFAVYDHREGQYMVFVPNNDDPDLTTETKAFVYSYRPLLKQDGWSEYTGWNWTCGCRSSLGILFFGDATGQIWRYGSRDNPIYYDFMAAAPPPDQPDFGTLIAISWELPWLDLKNRDRVKNSKHISFDTRGDSTFTCQMYVDNVISSPALSMTFTGGESTVDAPILANRPTPYKKMYAWPAKFEIMKLKFSGTVIGNTSFASITLKYKLGGINR